MGIDSRDDAGVFRLSADEALVQTVDFFTPIVDDPYSYGQIAAANALSDVYAMGGRPLTVLNIACFNPAMAPPEVWAEILRGAYDKTSEAGAVVLGGHSVEDNEPKFGMAVTGLVNPNHVFANTGAKVGDKIYLSKPLGSGIISTAAKNDQASPIEVEEAIRWMSELNRTACMVGLKAGVRCATDITGFGLVGHLNNIAKNSGVRIVVNTAALPTLSGVERLVAEGYTTGGAHKNRMFLADSLEVAGGVPEWLVHVALDPQSSGGLALVTSAEITEYPCIGEVVEGSGVSLV